MNSRSDGTGLIRGAYFVVLSGFVPILFIAEWIGHYRVYVGYPIEPWTTVLQAHSSLLLLSLPAGFGLTLLCLTLRASTIDFLLQWLRQARAAVWRRIKDPWSYVFFCAGIVLLAVLRSRRGRISLGEALSRLVKDMMGAFSSALPMLAVLVAIVAATWLLSLLHRLIPKDPQVFRRTFREWLWSSALLIVYIGAFHFLNNSVFSESAIEAALSQGAWRGMWKDYVLFTVILTLYVNGLLKWLRAAPYHDATTRTYSILLALAVSAVAAILALDAEHRFAVELEKGTVAPELTPERRIALAQFMCFRDYWLLVPCVVLHMVYVLAALITGTRENLTEALK